jgi:hypothetical protein
MSTCLESQNVFRILGLQRLQIQEIAVNALVLNESENNINESQTQHYL